MKQWDDPVRYPEERWDGSGKELKAGLEMWEEVPCLIYPRPGYPTDNIPTNGKVLKNERGFTTMTNNASSSEVRSRLAAFQYGSEAKERDLSCIATLVPQPLISYIYRTGLYGVGELNCSVCKKQLSSKEVKSGETKCEEHKNERESEPETGPYNLLAIASLPESSASSPSQGERERRWREIEEGEMEGEK